MKETPTVEVRPGSPADALCVAALATQVFLDIYASDGIRQDLAQEALENYSPAVFKRRLGDDRLDFILAERAGHLIGFSETQSQGGPAE